MDGSKRKHRHCEELISNGFLDFATANKADSKLIIKNKHWKTQTLSLESSFSWTPETERLPWTRVTAGDFWLSNAGTQCQLLDTPKELQLCIYMCSMTKLSFWSLHIWSGFSPNPSDHNPTDQLTGETAKEGRLIIFSLLSDVTVRIINHHICFVAREYHTLWSNSLSTWRPRCK